MIKGVLVDGGLSAIQHLSFHRTQALLRLPFSVLADFLGFLAGLIAGFRQQLIAVSTGFRQFFAFILQFTALFLQLFAGGLSCGYLLGCAGFFSRRLGVAALHSLFQLSIEVARLRIQNLSTLIQFLLPTGDFRHQSSHLDFLRVHLFLRLFLQFSGFGFGGFFFRLDFLVNGSDFFD